MIRNVVVAVVVSKGRCREAAQASRGVNDRARRRGMEEVQCENE